MTVLGSYDILLFADKVNRQIKYTRRVETIRTDGSTNTVYHLLAKGNNWTISELLFRVRNMEETIIDTKTKKYVKDVFDIDYHIEQGHSKILLISGVSSGKSTWVKDVLSKKGSVLFVTSRKAKAEADISYSTFSDVINWYSDENQTLVTNAGLARRIENKAVNSLQDLDDFINHFKYIVIDEIHSIATDSLFADSCPTMISFIEYVVSKGKPIVCMTGTPEPIQHYFEENGWLILNYLNTCNYVHPSCIYLIFERQVNDIIKKNCTDSKIVYFANRTNTITRKCKELLKANIVQPSEVAISVSKSRETEFFESFKKDIKDEAVQDIIQQSSSITYDSIIQSKLLPSECKILFSTSTLKEGIDIDNENVVLFCESHDLPSLIQYFGRARKENAKVYIVEDSTDHQVIRDELLYSYAVEDELDAANNYAKKHITHEENPLWAMDIIDLKKHVTTNPYIYFDVIKREFNVFHIKYHETCRVSRKKYWEYDLWQHCDTFGIALYDFTWRTHAEKTLHLMATRKDKYYEKHIGLICYLLFAAYKIDNKQPKRINEELEKQGIPLQIYHDKESKGEKRDKKYWQVLFVDDYDEAV